MALSQTSEVQRSTSDQKTSQVAKLMTRLAAEHRKAHPEAGPIRILNCPGIRAVESAARAKKVPFGPDGAATNGQRTVDRWLPIFGWSDEQVWATIRRSVIRHHPAYDAGMPRLSCVFCVLAGRRELTLAARLNPGLLQDYVAVEQQVRSDFKHGLSMKDIAAAAASRQ